MRSTHVGILVGAILGLALVLTSFGDMLVVALAALIGWIVARILEGDLDLNELLGRTGNASGRRGRQ